VWRLAVTTAVLVVAVVLVRAAVAQEPPRTADARLRSLSGCARTATVKVVLTGREIERVTFLVDARHHGSLIRPNSGESWVATLQTASLRVGDHRVSARVVFTAAVARPPVTLVVGVTRCASARGRPSFTG
jgi:hypothetical protein